MNSAESLTWLSGRVRTRLPMWEPERGIVEQGYSRTTRKKYFGMLVGMAFRAVVAVLPLA